MWILQSEFRGKYEFPRDKNRMNNNNIFGVKIQMRHFLVICKHCDNLELTFADLANASFSMLSWLAMILAWKVELKRSIGT